MLNIESVSSAVPASDPEVPEKPRRRQFTARYKLQMIEEAEHCGKRGELGALLRREGLYSSHLTTWRQQRRAGSFRALSARKRGRKSVKTAAERENEALRREVARLRRRLEKAEVIIDVQKKVSALLGIPLNSAPDDES